MASPWNLAYDGLDCPSGVFYRRHTRERNVHGASVHQIPPAPEENSFQPVTAATSITEPMFETPKARMESSKRPRKIYLPTLQISANVHVKALVAETVVTQSFQNHENHPIKHARYVFPLYDGSVVNAFKCFVGRERVLEGVVEPKEEAEKLFKRAIKRQQVAAMLEEHTPEIFETSIGSISPNTTVKVEISYISELKADLLSNDVVFVLPTSIAPRYGIPPSNPLDFENHTGTDQLGLEINIDVCLPVPVESIASRTHPISVKMGKAVSTVKSLNKINLTLRKTPKGFQEMNTEMDIKRATATLATRSTALEKDFILVVSPAQSIANTRAFIEPHPEFDDHSAVMISISPQDLAKQVETPVSNYTTSEVIFVIDCSVSMTDKINALKLALRVSVKSLPEEISFNLCMFGSSCQLLWGKSQPNTQENLDAAYAQINEFSANMGGTEIQAALERATSSRIVDKDTNVIVVTDGETWDLEGTLQLVRKASQEQGVRFFCLGIGDATSHALVEGIAHQGSGMAEVVTLSESGRWETRVIRLLKGALAPSSWNVTIQTETPDLPNRYISLSPNDGMTREILIPACIQAPFHIPALNTFSRFSVFLLLNNNVLVANRNKLTIAGTSSSGETAKLVVELGTVDKNISAVHTLAVHAVMYDLEHESSWLHNSTYELLRANNSVSRQKVARQAAISLGKKWSIVGKWTNFIAVEKRTDGTTLRSLADIYRPEISEIKNAPVMQFSSFENLLQSSEHFERPPVSVKQSPLFNACSRPMRRPRSRSTSMTRTESEIKPGGASPEPELEHPVVVAAPNQEFYKLQFPSDMNLAPQGELESMATEIDEDELLQLEANLSTPDSDNSGSVWDQDEQQSLSIEVFLDAQTAAGSFDLTEKTLDVLESTSFWAATLDDIRGRLSKISTEELLWPTILIVVYMEKEFGDERELLELIIHKAKRWLKGFLTEEQLISILEAAHDGVKFDEAK